MSDRMNGAYSSGYAAGVASVPAPTPTPTPAPTPTASAITVTRSSTVDYIRDVQSIGTEHGYVCMVDWGGHEFLIVDFYPGTAELLGASYSGTVTGSYNGIPMLENVAMTQQPVYYYYQDSRAYKRGHYHSRWRDDDTSSGQCTGDQICGIRL